MEKKIVIPKEAAGRKLAEYLVSVGEELSMDCGGRGTCGKCRVRLLSGAVTGEVPDSDGTIFACRAVCSDVGATIALPDIDGTGLTDFAVQSPHMVSEKAGEAEAYGVALDIGTTTLAAALVDLKSGEILASTSRLNPQRSFGADVMSRIAAAERGDLAVMQRLICTAAGEMIQSLADSRRISQRISQLVVAGNTTMLHLFCGVSLVGMARYPFTPAFTEGKVLSGESLGLPVEEVFLLPSASAFIGGDITSGLLVTGFLPLDDAAAQSKTKLLLDLGTNGEMVLSRNGHLTATSTAAGPALEGAGISCGVGGIAGAVCSVENIGNALRCQTIDHASPIGICGSGLIDLIACLLSMEEIDETGYMEEDYVLAEGKNGPICLTPKDVREFQLAKGAIRAGIDVLVSECGTTLDEIDTVYLAGGLGFYMNPVTARMVGLIPSEFAGKIETVGNSALGGAVECLLHREAREVAASLARSCRVVELNKSALFQEAFMEHMMFEE